jgi:hypothetical protein
VTYTILKNSFFVIAVIVLFSVIPASFAETYKLDVDGDTFDVTYSLDGQVIAMQADQESTSLLIGITEVEESVFEIGFSSVLLSAENGEFVVLVDGLETDYSIEYDGDDPMLAFQLEAGSEEIEIIGTNVIPEFPFGAIAMMGAVSVMVLVFSRAKSLFR